MDKSIRIPLPSINLEDNELDFLNKGFTLSQVNNYIKYLPDLNIRRYNISSKQINYSLTASNATSNVRNFNASNEETTISYRGKLFISNTTFPSNSYLFKKNKVAAAVGIFMKDKDNLIKNDLTKNIKRTFKEIKVFDTFVYEEEVKVFKSSNLDTEDISKYFIDAFRFIHEKLNNGRNVLVFCETGRGCAPTVVLAFLIWRFRFTYEEAKGFLKEFVSFGQMNKSFQLQLQEWDSFCKMKFETPKINEIHV